MTGGDDLLEIAPQPSSQADRAEVEEYIARLLARQDRINTEKASKLKELNELAEAEVVLQISLRSQVNRLQQLNQARSDKQQHVINTLMDANNS